MNTFGELVKTGLLLDRAPQYYTEPNFARHVFALAKFVKENKAIRKESGMPSIAVMHLADDSSITVTWCVAL